MSVTLVSHFYLLFLIYYEWKLWSVNDFLDYFYVSKAQDRFFINVSWTRQKCIFSVWSPMVLHVFNTFIACIIQLVFLLEGLPIS